VCAVGAHQEIQRHALLASICLASMHGPERLYFGLDVIGPFQRIFVQSAFLD
jgi:hypothetical protein